jgi:hypothetical protein
MKWAREISSKATHSDEARRTSPTCGSHMKKIEDVVNKDLAKKIQVTKPKTKRAK